MALRAWLKTFSKDLVTIRERTSRDSACTRIRPKHPPAPVHFPDLEGFEATGNLWSTRDRVAAALGISRTDLLPRILDAQTHPR
ncbi:MAG: hypothetical protein ACT4OI_00425, partial [Methanobacteriota archaeon]